MDIFASVHYIPGIEVDGIIHLYRIRHQSLHSAKVCVGSGGLTRQQQGGGGRMPQA